MTITDFSPGSGLIGGGLIGLSAVLLMVSSGHIAGASGIIAGLLPPMAKDKSWRLVFIIGLLIGAAWCGLFFYDVNSIHFQSGTLLTILGGLLVGFGTQLGSGCTSGHGICGLARLSKRSSMATLTFMTVAFITVFIMRHIARQ